MKVLVKHLGVADYAKTYAAMQTFTKERDANTPDEIWVLEHPPVFTLGLAGDASNLHSCVCVFWSRRGGGSAVFPHSQ